ncbi:ribonuclease Z [Actinomadura flavalba]|uniref:ribonuclease Z n=1 Tax=Actinomadura flavalba TaxID=1120938 RepID=UPI0003825A84|nr:ribonuclease Z [Actinomadura flavalba]
MSVRELVVLGSSSAVPTRYRNHNGYLLRWDGHGLLFDPGEGTQRQLVFAGASATDLTWLCVTHFHGDHCLGVPGIVQRVARDGVPHPVRAVFPASGAVYWERLRHASAFRDTGVIRETRLSGEHVAIDTGDAPFGLAARRLSHPVESYGYRLTEPDGLSMLPGELARRGISGPQIGVLRARGEITAPDGSTVTLAETSRVRPGQTFAFVMDTRLCDGAFALAENADLLVIESTFLDAEAHLARDHGHLTAAQAARVAAESGARHLVLTHFSERYRPEDEERFVREAASVFDGEITLAHDLDRVPMPRRNTARG